MLKRVPWVAVAVCLLIAGMLLTLQQSLYPWPRRLPHVRLEPSRPILRDADVTPDNAFFYLRQLTSAPRSSDDWSKEYDRFCDLGMAGGPYPALEARLTEVAAKLELCRQAAAQPKCQVVTADSVDSLLPYLGPVRDIVRNLDVRAARAAATGDWAAAGDDYRIALRISDDLTRGGCLINYMVNYSCSSITSWRLRRLAIEIEPPPEFLRGMIQFLAGLDRNTEPLAEAMRYQRLSGRDVVRVVDNHLSKAWALDSSGRSTPTAATVDVVAYCLLPLAGSTPRRTAAHLDTVYSYVIDVAAEPRPSGRSAEDEALAFLAKGRERVRFLFDDPVGRLLAYDVLPTLDTFAEKHRAHVATRRATKLALALRLYQQAHDGKLPARLEDLVPDCLPAVPVDPFSPDGEPFLYRTEAGGKWTIYSRGPNLRDDGAAWNYLDLTVWREHRDSLDVIFSASDPEQRRDRWRLQHPGEK